MWASVSNRGKALMKLSQQSNVFAQRPILKVVQPKK